MITMTNIVRSVGWSVGRCVYNKSPRMHVLQITINKNEYKYIITGQCVIVRKFFVFYFIFSSAASFCLLL